MTLNQELQAERQYSKVLVEENKELCKQIYKLKCALKRAGEVVELCEKSIGVLEYDPLCIELEHIKDLLAISEFAYDSTDLDSDVVPLSAQISPSHRSISFQLTSPIHPLMHGAGSSLHPGSPPLCSPGLPMGPSIISLDFSGNYDADIADVGPPLSPPVTAGLVNKITSPDEAAIEIEQEKVDREESARGSEEVEQDLERS